MTREDAKKRLSLKRKCMDCEFPCYDSEHRPMCHVIEEKEIIDLREALDVAIEALSEQRPKGKWIETYDEIDARYSRHGYKCPKCDKFAHYFVGGSEDWWDIEKPNFCPNCGADMRGE